MIFCCHNYVLINLKKENQENITIFIVGLIVNELKNMNIQS